MPFFHGKKNTLVKGQYKFTMVYLERLRKYFAIYNENMMK